MSQTRLLYTKYYKEYVPPAAEVLRWLEDELNPKNRCLEAFPSSIEFSSQTDAVSLPVEPLRKVDSILTIPVPLYYAGFFVSAAWLCHWGARTPGWPRCNDIQVEVVRRWEAEGKPEPFMSPKVTKWPTGDFLIYFVTFSYPVTMRHNLDLFYDNRDAILDRALGLMKFPDDEKELVKTKLFKWHRYMRTMKKEVEALPEDACLRRVPQSQSRTSTASNSDSHDTKPLSG
ncbi:hypothetical protein CC1G_07269 [Coprinopsis cinerea okayama7|uniref:Uncharacterized protein n=1 Tax=Coprinopsis cinerea (strain Okayama-7 / 130 / ATCC MYA-4618 / FGSC 9003) TaxID=240176 RepID=A8PD58_COPC7|nr:hypothetical protein CC1G_07269 [Coprinopsis cinerea okayama7\|eukprot:XP_001840539.1 hypothetical protein CC1G_07269 [Coprinopsis cinerea okayama7\